jgi:hypothetical protein
MDIFEGLKSHERVLLVMGVVFFITLLGLLVYYAVKRMPFKGLLPFFAIPIVMVGFPGIQKITFDNGVLGIEKLTEKVEQDPTNTAAKKELETRLKAIENRPISRSANLKILERAYSAVGNKQKATEFRRRLMPVKPVPGDNINP